MAKTKGFREQREGKKGKYSTGKVIGSISNRALTMIQDWRELHKEELLENWKLAKQNEPLRRINPLE